MVSGTADTTMSCLHGVAEQSLSCDHAPGRFVLSLMTREQRLLFSQQSECGKQLVLHGLSNYWHCHRKGFLDCVCYKNNRVNGLFFFPWALRIFSKCWLLKGPRKTLGKKKIVQLKLPFLNVATNQWLGKEETCHLKTNCSYLVKPRSLKQQLSTRE